MQRRRVSRSILLHSHSHIVYCLYSVLCTEHIILFRFLFSIFFSRVDAACRMTAYDRQYFMCDPKTVDWRNYYIVFALGARVYLVRDALENYDAARVRMKWMKLTHYTIKYLCLVLLLSIFYFILY